MRALVACTPCSAGSSVARSRTGAARAPDQARGPPGCTRKRAQRGGRGGGGDRRKLQCLTPGRASLGDTGSVAPEGGRAVARDSSRLGAWTPEEKQGLLELVADLEPCGAADWEARALALACTPRMGGAARVLPPHAPAGRRAPLRLLRSAGAACGDRAPACAAAGADQAAGRRRWQTGWAAGAQAARAQSACTAR